MLNVNRAMMLERGAAPAAEDSSYIDFGHVVGMARRRWKLIAGSAVLLGLLAVAYVAVATPMFLSEGQIIVDTQTSQAMQRQDLSEAGMTDTSLVDSQVEIINSDDIARDVVRKLDLTQDPEFVGPSAGVLGAASTFIGKAIGSVTSLVKSPSNSAPADLESRAVDTFKHLLTVKRTGLTYVITIDFWSRDPAKAARIANAVAQAYIDSVLDARFAATRRTSDWLEGRLQQIRKQSNDADRALQEFKVHHNIVETNRGSMSEQQLSDLNSTLATAGAATAEAKARVDRARDVGNDPLGSSTVSDALSSPVISRLRAQYLDLNNRAMQLAARYGESHRTVTDLRNQMTQIKASVQDELRHITDAYESDYKIAEAREASLRDSLAKLVTQSDSTSLDRVKLQDLESTADSYRALYNGYLQRFQEATQRESFPIANARVIAEAMPPLGKAAPKSFLIVAGSLAVGLVIGLAGAFAREIVDSFVSPDDVEAQTGLPCLGVLPDVTKHPGSQRGKPAGAARAAPAGESARAGGGGRNVDAMVIDAPFSRYAETIRNIKISIDTAPGAKGAQIVAVTSAVPNEGKTTVSMNLAQMMANAGNRVLLIDGDLSNRRLSQRSGATARGGGLLEALADPTRLSSLIRRDPRTGLDVLPCTSEAPIPHRAEVLASAPMGELLRRARDSYQYVILDLAPIVPVVDARAIARYVDCFVLVIEWRQTSRKVVAEALATEAIQQRVIGAVLNKVDSHTLQQMESYKGKAINSYYIDDKLA